MLSSDGWKRARSATPRNGREPRTLAGAVFPQGRAAAAGAAGSGPRARGPDSSGLVNGRPVVEPGLSPGSADLQVDKEKTLEAFTGCRVVRDAHTKSR